MQDKTALGKGKIHLPHHKGVINGSQQLAAAGIPQLYGGAAPILLNSHQTAPCPRRAGIRKKQPLPDRKRERIVHLLSGLGQIEPAAHREALVIRGEEGMPALIGDHYFLGGLQIDQHILTLGNTVGCFALPRREHPKAAIGKIWVLRLLAFYRFPPHLCVAAKVKDDDLLARVPQGQVAAGIQHGLHAVFLIGKGRNFMGAEGELLQKIAIVQQQSIIGTENLFIGHPLAAQRDRFKDLPAAIEVIEDLILKIAHHPRQEEVIPCEGGSQRHEAVAVLTDKPMAPRLPNSGIPILIDKSFPHLAHHGAGSLALDLEGGVA